MGSSVIRMLVNKFSPFLEPKVYFFPEPDESIPSPFCFLKVHLNSLASTPRSFRWSPVFFFRFSHQTSLCISLISHAFHVPRIDMIAAVVTVDCTELEDLRAVFSIILLNPTCWVQILFLAPCSQIPPICSLP